MVDITADAFSSVIQGGPAWVLLFVVWTELQKQSRKLDEIVEAIAYWGKRKDEK